MKRETKKMYHTVLAFYKTTIIPMIRWSFEWAEFLIDRGDIRNPVQIEPSRVLTRIAVPDVELDDPFIYPDQMRKEFEGMNTVRKYAPTPKSSDFAISLAAYIQAPSRTYLLCGREEEEEVSNEEENDAN
jgi:hypothetical protein